MQISELAPALSRAARAASFTDLCAHHGAGLVTLADVPDMQTLLARLDAERSYSATRDALLADLLRLHRRCRDGATLSALLYALHLGVVRRWGRLARRGVDPQEGAAALLAALITSLDSFDPDARTPHVQAGVELSVRNHLRRTRREERRRREAHARIARIVESARADLDAGIHRFEALIERPEVRAANDPACASPSLDRDASRHVESLLVSRAILRPRDASLVCLVDVHDLTVAEAASSLGMRFEGARKALLRARRRLRDRRGALEALLQPLAHRA